jgi:hypothetical protein
MNIQTLGIDIAKNVFQLHGVSRSGHVVLKRRLYGRLLLGAQVRGTGSSGEDHQPAICEAIRPQTEERRQ